MSRHNFHTMITVIKLIGLKTMSIKQQQKENNNSKTTTTDIYTPGRRQSKTLLTIDQRGSKIVARNSVFDCHLSPVRRQMAVENSVSNDLDLRLSMVSTFSIAAYQV